MPESSNSTFKMAAVQAAPVYLDRDATIAKACDLIAQAAGEGARLIAFPEAFVPAYPDWVWDVAPGEQGLLNAMYARYVEQSVTVPSDATERLGRAARQAGAYVVVGVSERNAEASNTSLYNTLLFLGPRGELLGRHRKLVPTGAERLVWAQGDGSGLRTYDTPLGRLGGLICWENYMPLARFALYAQGIQLYVASTWDSGDVWLATLRHIAKEGRVYVAGVCIAQRKSDIPDTYEFKRRLSADSDEWISEGDSAIVDPSGSFVAGPVREREQILYAAVDPAALTGPRWMLDVAGHYARPDVFELVVHDTPRPMLNRGGSLPGPK